MTQYVDKAAVVAEIKGLIRANELYLSEPATDEVRFQKTGAYSVLNDLLHFLDTLEVKEVGEDCWLFTLQNRDLQECNCFFDYFPSKSDLQEAAKDDVYAILNVTKLTKGQANKLLGKEE